MISERAAKIADQPATTVPKCTAPCVLLYVGDYQWRCEKCLHYAQLDAPLDTPLVAKPQEPWW